MNDSPRRRSPRAGNAPTRSTEDRILAAAEKLFARNGYDGVSNQRLAAEAGLTIGALYHYFSNKDAIYAATIRRSLSANPRLPEGVDDPRVPAEKRLAMLASWFVGIIMADKPPGRLLLRELLDPRADTSQIIRSTLFQMPFDLFQGLLAEVVPKAQKDDALASFLALLFGLSNLKGIRRLAPQIGGLLSTPDQIGAHATDLLLNGLGASRTGPPQK